MKVSDILQIKGSKVKTITPDTSAHELSVRLRAEQIGALLVSGDGRTIDGIVSERDLAYALAAHGSELPAVAVSRLMAKIVVDHPCDKADDPTTGSPCARQERRHVCRARAVFW